MIDLSLFFGRAVSCLGRCGGFVVLSACLFMTVPALAYQDGEPAAERSGNPATSSDTTTTATSSDAEMSPGAGSLTAVQQARIDSLKLQASFAAVADNHEVVIRNLAEVLQFVPTDSSLHYRIGLAYDALWQYEKATASYRRAIEGGMDTPDMKRDLALSLLESRQYDESASILSDLLESYPSSVDLRMAYAMALAGLGRTQEALEDIEILYEMYPMSASLTANYAELLWVDGQTQASFDHVEAYIEKRPEEPFMYSLLGEMHLRGGDVNAAHRAFLEGKNLVKRRSSRVGAIFDSGLTYTFAQKDAADEALRHADTALEQTPNNPYLYRNRGLALLANGQRDAACESFRESLERGYERMFLQPTQFGAPPSQLIETHCP